MHVASDPFDFKPPQAGRWAVPVVLALVAHALLMAALTWGIRWEKDAPPAAFEAELWSGLPREAAPRAEAPPPPAPEPEPRPQPRPEPPPPPSAPEPEPARKPPDIAIEQALKKKREEERERQQALAEEKARKEKVEREKKDKEQKRLADQKKADEQKKKLAEAKKDELARKEAAQRDADRKAAMARIMGQAGATGGPESRGSAERSSGPSSGYGARVQARVRPNIRYSEEFPRSLRTEIEVRALPDGTITARRVVGSSGNPAWDDAALKAIDRTGALPRDTDGTVPSPIIIVVRPND
jgi:colicin import membrane protein